MVRILVCRIIILTSILWFLIDIIVLTFHIDCLNEKCKIKKLIKLKHPEEILSKEEIKTTPFSIQEMDDKFKLNQFNIVASDLIPLNRSLPDVRLEECKTKTYPKHLPKTSIVIVFHNEAWTTLLRTIWSVINSSPRDLLQEIILVDDASTRKYLGEELEAYVKTVLVPVRVIRVGNRSGLVKARLLGAKYVKGEIITFLDSHCECNKGWLEPLLSRIVLNRRTVVSPIIDIISDKTFEYKNASDKIWGGFTWRLFFKWNKVPERELIRRKNDSTMPLRTPAIAGGLFSVDKDYFYELGSYDEGMEIWGGENLELSFRVWMCGGVLEIVTCSRVGHVFRKNSPYTFPTGISRIVNHNNARLAEVWLDEFKLIYYSLNPVALQVDIGDLTGRKALRKRPECNKSFYWYLKNIYPERRAPKEMLYFTNIRNVGASNKCIDTSGRDVKQEIGVAKCDESKESQLFVFSAYREILSKGNCLETSSKYGTVKVVECHGKGGNQIWVYKKETMNIVHRYTGSCLQASSSGSDTLVLRQCASSDDQKWVVVTEFPYLIL